jgi:ATP-dependent DNA helicase RecG
VSVPESLRSVLTAIRDGAAATILESDRLDFKTVGRSDEDALVNLTEAASCFANAQGGYVVVRIADRASVPEAFVGTTLDMGRTQRRIYELTTPALIVTVDAFEWAGSRLLVLTVPRSSEVHQVRGKATERVGTSCEPMTAARIAAVVSERRGDDWSAEDSHVSAEKVSVLMRTVRWRRTRTGAHALVNSPSTSSCRHQG